MRPKTSGTVGEPRRRPTLKKEEKMIDWQDEETTREAEEYLESGELFEGMDSDDITNWYEDDD